MYWPCSYQACGSCESGVNTTQRQPEWGSSTFMSTLHYRGYSEPAWCQRTLTILQISTVCPLVIWGPATTLHCSMGCKTWLRMPIIFEVMSPLYSYCPFMTIASIGSIEWNADTAIAIVDVLTMLVPGLWELWEWCQHHATSTWMRFEHILEHSAL